MGTSFSRGPDIIPGKYHVDTSWLEGTNVREPERNSQRIEDVKQRHVKKVRRRPKSRYRHDNRRLDHAACSSDERGRHTDGRLRPPRAGMSFNSCDVASNASGGCTDTPPLAAEQDDSTTDSDNPGCSGSGWVQYEAFDSSDDESVGISNRNSLLCGEPVPDIDADDVEEGITEHEQDLILNGASLSSKFLAKCAFWDKKNYYSNNLSIDRLGELLTRYPKQYKQCTLHIESSHKAKCVLLQPEDNLKEIEISGRSKCGKHFSEDEVVVEVLNHDQKADKIPRFNKVTRTNQETKAYGNVVGCLNRKRFKNVPHPVLLCELDEVDYHLMRPLDRTVPKLHIFNKYVKNKFQVEIYHYNTETGVLNFHRVVDINPAQRHSYVFLVVYIRWDAVYPLGAVIKVLKSDGNLDSGLKILQIQYQVPTTYSCESLECTEEILTKMSDQPIADIREDREDLTDVLSVFTIDPPDAKDLDDALSVRKLDNGIIEVGVHIADVSSYVQKGDPVDQDAKARATTFYPGQGKQPHHMLPKPLSQNLCSLLPGKDRLSLSTFFQFSMINSPKAQTPRIKRTVVKSRRKFTYTEVQDILLDHTVDEEFSEDIKTLYSIAKTVRCRRLGESMHSFPVDIDLAGGNEDESMFETLEAHFLVEEFMILTNKTAAELVCESYNACALLRCQEAPAPEKVNKWLTDYPRIADIVLKLQNIRPTATRQLKITNAPISRYRVVIELQKWIWSSLEHMVKEGNFRDAWKLIGSDEFHPEQALAWVEWIQCQQHAEYRCLGSVKSRPEAFHFSLGISLYTHFTSPIRRYADLVNHRLVHAALNKQRTAPYTQCEIEDICDHINDVSRRAKMYQNHCRVLHYGHVLRNNPVMLNSFIEDVSEHSILLNIPGMRSLPQQSREIALNLLNVSRKPQILKDRDDDRPFNILTLAWQKRLYSHRGYAPSTRGIAELRVDPHQKAIFQQYSRWTDILKALLDVNTSTLKKIFSERADYQEGDQLRSYVPACTSTVNDVSSEIRQGAITKHFCDFSMSFNHAQIISVQLSAEPQKAAILPYPQLVALTSNVKLCLQHPNDPVKYLANYSTRKAHSNGYKTIKEYIEIWLPLVHMEAATMAARDDSITVNDLSVKLTDHSGTFSLRSDFCEDRKIAHSAVSLEFLLYGIEDDETNTKNKYAPALDFLCLKCQYAADDSAYKHLHESPGRTRIWLAHGHVEKIRKIKKSIEVQFMLHSSSLKPPPQLLDDNKKPVCSVEILLKPESDRRLGAALMCLDKAGVVAKAAALGHSVCALDRDHMAVARRMETDVDVLGLAPNNPNQHLAIQRALCNRLTFIQGPPGTGKTYTGMKLLYLFTKLNKIWHQEGNPFKQVVFCGPSNKSVDLVAKWTKRKLGELAPRMIRMYGTSHESMDYPLPCNLFSSKSRKSDNRPDEVLHEIALHHLIRQEGKPHADEIRSYDRYFNQFRDRSSIQHPDEAQDFKIKIKAYNALLSKAEQIELKNYDVIFCTTAMTTSPKFIRATRDRIFQCIIDESGMCTEPESLATIIATKAEQVVLIGDHKQLRPVVICQHAANMGLEKSLFERHAQKAIMLTTQYRMNPRICMFVSAQFYNNQLKTAPSLAWEEPEPLSIWKYKDIPHVFCHVEGVEEYLTVSTEEGNEQSCSNKAEVDKVLSVFHYMVKMDRVDPKYINIISQYNAQCHAIKDAVLQSGYINCNVHTVVSSQGGEWDYVIFSTARSLPDYKIEPNPTLGWCKQNLGFITDEHQINVALSRARKGLVIIGNRHLLRCDRVWTKLLDHYQAAGCVVDGNEFPPKRRKRKAARTTRQTSQEFYQGTDRAAR